MPHDVNSRIIRLEQYFKPAACPVCLGRPSRLVFVHPVTDEVISETMPESGCPSCGTPIFRTLVIDGDDDSPGEVA